MAVFSAVCLQVCTAHHTALHDLSSGATCAEFYSQGDREQKAGLPVTPFLKREGGYLARSQLAFITFVSKPMLETLEPALPKFCAMVKPLMEHNCFLYNTLTQEGDGARYKTIGVEYSSLMAKHGVITDDLPVED